MQEAHIRIHQKYLEYNILSMNILLITVRSDFGGGPRHVNQLLKSLSNDIDIYMAYPQGGEPYGVKWAKENRIKGYCEIPYRRFSIKALYRLKTFVKQHKIDIVHSHGNGAGVYSRLLKLTCSNIKVIHTFHGISDVYSSKIKLYISYFVGRILSPLANTYIAVSNGEKKMAIERHFSKDSNTKVIYNGIAAKISEKAKNQTRTIKIVTLSRFDYQKNMQSMFRIAERVKDLPVHFTWVGDGEDREELEKKAQEENLNIKFTGFSSQPMNYLIQADWYISTSRFEGLPYALIEAASVGLPIIASNVKGNNEVVRNGYNGFLFESENEAVDLISHIVNGNIDYNTLSRNAICYYQENFTLETMIKKTEEVYFK